MLLKLEILNFKNVYVGYVYFNETDTL